MDETDETDDNGLRLKCSAPRQGSKGGGGGGGGGEDGGGGGGGSGV